jgi:kynurenine formamidase
MGGPCWGGHTGVLRLGCSGWGAQTGGWTQGVTIVLCNPWARVISGLEVLGDGFMVNSKVTHGLALLVGVAGAVALAPILAPKLAPKQTTMDTIGGVVDMQQPILPTMAIWPGDPKPAFTNLATIAKEGYFLRSFAIGEHSATHINAAGSFKTGAPLQETYSGAKMVAPAVVIDVRTQAAANPDYTLDVKALDDWEKANGAIPQGAVVLMLTGWASKWQDQKAFFNEKENGMHFPGFSIEASKWLFENRKIGGLGIDTHGLDPGQDETFATNNLIAEKGGIALECLNNIDKLPAKGAVIVVGGLKLVGGSGAPAAVTALLPKGK